MKKVAFILFSNGIGGAERAVEKLMSCSLANDKNTILIVNSEIYEYFKNAIGEENVLDVGKLYLNNYFLRKLRRLFDFTQIIIWQKKIKIKKILEDFNVELVITNLMYDLYLMYMLKNSGYNSVSVVSVVHGLIGIDASLPRYIFDAKFTIKMLKESSKVIAVSPAIRNFLVKINEVFEEKTHVVENGVEILSNCSRMVSQSKMISFLFCGGVKPIKGGHLLCSVIEEMLSERFEFTVTIAGPVAINSFWHALSLNFPNSVKIVGFVPEIKLNEMLLEHDCVLMPSISEGAPLVAFDSIRLKTPVLASQIPAFEYYIHEKYRFELTHTSLKNMLVKFLKDSNFRSNYIYIYEPLSWSEVWASYKKVVNDE